MQRIETGGSAKRRWKILRNVLRKIRVLQNNFPVIIADAVNKCMGETVQDVKTQLKRMCTFAT